MNLEELKALCENATPGPWTAMDYDHSPGDQGVPIIGGGLAGSMEGHLTAYTMTLNNVSQSELDAQFIAAARTALPKLTAAVETVLAMHSREVSGVVYAGMEEAWCPECGQHWPCDTAKAINNALEES